MLLSINSQAADFTISIQSSGGSGGAITGCPSGFTLVNGDLSIGEKPFCAELFDKVTNAQFIKNDINRGASCSSFSSKICSRRNYELMLKNAANNGGFTNNKIYIGILTVSSANSDIVEAEGGVFTDGGPGNRYFSSGAISISISSNPTRELRYRCCLE